MTGKVNWLLPHLEHSLIVFIVGTEEHLKFLAPFRVEPIEVGNDVND